MVLRINKDGLIDYLGTATDGFFVVNHVTGYWLKGFNPDNGNPVWHDDNEAKRYDELHVAESAAKHAFDRQ